MFKRWQEDILCEELAVRRGVHLTGARQCGKSTLAEYIAKGKMRHLTLDNEALRIAARNDPSSFVDRIDGKTMVIDEIQKVPSLLDAIKIKLDHSNDKGQYLLTGSSNLRFMKSVTDSLAGRLGRVRLRTLALGEINGGKGSFLCRAFKRDFPISFPKFDKRDAIHAAMRGGYPEPLEYSARLRRRWFAEYFTDLLTKDIEDITEVRKVDSLRLVGDWMMAYTSKFFEMKDLAQAAQLSKETLATYLSAMKALYIIDEVPAWSRSDYAKICKRSKYFASDSALSANLLGWDDESVFFDDDKCGKLIETWVYHELACLAELDSGYEITQYRDSEKREIDFLIKGLDDRLLGIEVKAGSISQGDFKHLKWFKDNLAKAEFTGIVLYSGNDTLSFGDGMYAVPLVALGM